MRLLDFVTELPEDPNPGDRYILEDDAYIYSESGSVIAVWNEEDGEWEFIVPQIGYLAFILSETGLFWFNGNEWVELPINPVQGPASAIDREVAVFDGLTGKWITGSGAFIDADQKFHGATSIYVDELILNDNSIYSETIIRTVSELHTEDKLAVKRELEFYQTNDISTGGDQEIPNPETVITRFTESGLNSVAGITPGKSKFVILTNVKGSLLTIKHLTGTAGSQIDTGIDGDLDIEDQSSIMLYEDVESDVWRVIGGTGAGGGGGGASLSWYMSDDFLSPSVSYLPINPSSGINFPSKYLVFNKDDLQYIFMKYKVSASFKAGKNIVLKSGRVRVNSTDTSKNILFRTYARLVKPGDNVSNLTNSVITSANTEINVGSVAGQFLDLTALNLSYDSSIGT
jgi:hypothetical protein